MRNRTLIIAASALSVLTPQTSSAQPRTGCAGLPLFVPVPTDGETTGIFFGVDGAAPDDVWGVGREDRADLPFGEPDNRTLTAHWDGSVWTEVPAPNPSNDFNSLEEVLALRPDLAIAVGVQNPPGGPSQSLTLLWDGSAWTLPNQLVVECGSSFFDIDTAGKDIWATGGGGCPPTPQSAFPPLTARWNGSGWDRVPAPTTGMGRGADLLLGVDGVAEDDVWAVGRFRISPGGFQILILHFNGSEWTRDPVSTPGLNDHLRDVVAVAADNAWAVGDWFHPTESVQPLIMRFDGSSWQQVALPIFPEGAAELRAVTARAPDDIWAAGTHATDGGVPRPLLMHYDGGTWSVVPVATPGSHEWFRGIRAVPGGDVWAVGQYFNPDAFATTALSVRIPAGSCCPADFDGDGAVDIADFLAFLSAFAAGDPRADFTGDGAVNVPDVLAFLAAYAAGCP